MSSAAVTNWATDYDIFDSAYLKDPFSVWDGLRTSTPIAHTERWGGSWLPTRYADVAAIAHDVEHFSSAEITVVPPIEQPEVVVLPAGVPPISSDPPEHTWTRRLLLPWFSPKTVLRYEEATRALCRRLIDEFIETGRADAAADYAQQIPVRVISMMLGVPEDLSDTFTGWVRDVLEFAHDLERRKAGTMGVANFFIEQMKERRDHPGDDLISDLLRAEVDGAPVPDDVILGICALTLIAGVDTTWSAIGSSLWHLATHPEDCARLVEDRDVWPTAIEELLRAYSPVTMARVVRDEVQVAGCVMQPGDKVLLNFPGANRDPEMFPDADRVLLDRQHNRHVAFGVGIHRCAGSNLARMELRVALEEWLARIPTFRLADDGEVTWAGGQVRGPRSVPVVFP